MFAFFKIKTPGVEEIAQQLQTLATLVKDLGLVPRTHMVAHLSITSEPAESVLYFLIFLETRQTPIK